MIKRNKTSNNPLYEQIAKIEMAGNNYPPPGPGEYLFEILRTQYLPPAANHQGLFIAEFKVLQSEGPAATAAGKTVKDSISFKYSQGLSNTKKFIANAMGMESDDDTEVQAEDGATFEDLVRGACEPDVSSGKFPANPLAGRKIRANVRPHKEDYVKVKYFIAED